MRKPILFKEEEVAPEWKKHWQGMPEFTSEDLTPFRTLYVHFENAEDVQAFAELVGQKISPRTKSIWHPKQTRKLCSMAYAYVGDTTPESTLEKLGLKRLETGHIVRKPTKKKK